MFVKHHILALALVPLVLVAAAMSYHRFMVQEDYIVQYEGTCDPAVENCYVACEDEECTSVYYYTLVQKYAADVYAQCGPDITDCEAASICVPDDQLCSIEACELSEEDCVGPGEFEQSEEEDVNEEATEREELPTEEAEGSESEPTSI